ncbi:MAG TPA: hypothetical protein VKA48_10625, partial [Gammaproteobacteria bacterium]|nr:hypothetical protein [Gammaproteobacteria bacterium]
MTYPAPREPQTQADDTGTPADPAPADIDDNLTGGPARLVAYLEQAGGVATKGRVAGEFDVAGNTVRRWAKKAERAGRLSQHRWPTTGERIYLLAQDGVPVSPSGAVFTPHSINTSTF